MTDMILGVVTAAASAGRLTVRLANGAAPVLIPAARSAATAAVSDQVLVAVQEGQAWVVAVLGVGTPTPAPAPTPVPPAPPPVAPPVTLTPLWTGSYRDSAWRTDASDLYQGDWTGRGVQTGAAYYGTGFQGRGTIATATATLTRLAGGDGVARTPTMVLLSGTHPAPPSVLATAAGPSLAIGQTAGWDLPAAWLPRLASGEATGVGIHVPTASPYVHLSPDIPILTRFA